MFNRNSISAGDNAQEPRSFFRFIRGRRGSLLTWSAFLMVPLMGFVGLGVDTARGYMVRARLSQSLDAAALAAGRQTADAAKAEESAKMVFKANFPAGYMDASLTGPTITFNAGKDTVTASASAVLPTYFIHLVGTDTVTVSASSEVTRKTVFMDVVVSIDVSGSMGEWTGGVKKIDAAKSATGILVDSLFGAEDSKDLLKMGLVMWNANVKMLPVNGTGSSYNPAQTTSKNVGSFKNPYTGVSQTKLYYAKGSPVPLLEPPPSGWTGCTHARYFDDSKTNDADIYVNMPTVGSGTSRKVWKGFKPAVQTNTALLGLIPVMQDMQCPNHGIQRLTKTKGQMVSALTQVKDPTGNTNMAMGLVWAWKVLGVPGSGSPFQADGTPEPAAGEGEMIRAIVIMTDGANTQSQTDAYEGDLTPSEIDDRTKAAAQKIKDAGIIIYTIRFGTEASESLLKTVASGPGAPYYQYAPDAAALKEAFQEIGNHLSKLRLSK
jgi:Flp pilus assembly protein TadG